MLKTSIQACLLLLLSLLFSNSLYGATPKIFGVAGQIQSGSVLTITGENLVDEDRTNWLPLFKSGTAYGFEGSNYTSDGYAPAPDSGRHEPIYDTNIKIAGSKSYQGHIHGAYAGGGGSNNASSGAYIDTGYSRADLYVRLYSRWNSL